MRACSSLDTDRRIVEFVVNALSPGVRGLVAIDAPLRVPNEFGSRLCDRQVAAVFGRYQAAPYPVNRHNLNRYGGLRGESITRELQALGFRLDPWIGPRTPTQQVVEVFPHPATISLFGLNRTLKYKSRSGRDYRLRWQELARLQTYLVDLSDASPPLELTPDLAALQIDGKRGRSFKEIEDLLDAVVCAYSALYAWHHGPRGYAIYGGAGDGHILVPMTSSMWSRIKIPRILFLDRDGTLNRSFGNRPPNDPAEVEILPGVGHKLHQYAALGWRIVVVTNQGGVAFGYLTEAEALAVHQTVLHALPVAVDATYLCPHHPEGTIARYAVDCPNRKPAPGAILDALARFEAKPGDCLFVGDQESDQQAAQAAGVPFAWASHFFEEQVTSLFCTWTD